MSVVETWLRDGVVPAPLGHQLVLLSHPDLLLAVNGLLVWPGGVELRLEFRHRPAEEQGEAARRRVGAVEAATRIGVQVDDADVVWFGADPVQPTTPDVEYTGGRGGGEGHSGCGWYVPLPETFDVLTLRARRDDAPDAPEGTATLSGTEVRQAAAAILRSPWSG